MFRSIWEIKARRKPVKQRRCVLSRIYFVANAIVEIINRLYLRKMVPLSPPRLVLSDTLQLLFLLARVLLFEVLIRWHCCTWQRFSRSFRRNPSGTISITIPLLLLSDVKSTQECCSIGSGEKSERGDIARKFRDWINGEVLLKLKSF